MSRADPADPAAVAGLAGARVLVVGMGRSGAAATRALLARGAAVTVSTEEDPATDARAAAAAAALEGLGAVVRAGAAALTSPPPATTLVVTSPGVPPHAPLLRAAAARGIAVWGEVELAWRLRPLQAGRDVAAPWLGVTGTNGKTTTVTMLAAVLSDRKSVV